MKTVTVTSDNKDDAYVATVLLFNNIAVMAAAGLHGWGLASTFTSVDQEEYMTEYSNGKMIIRAESVCGHHTYKFASVND